MNYYSSDPNKSVKFVAKKNSVFSTLTELYNALDETGWCEYSVFLKGQWNNEKKCCGQCNATVLLVQEYFGGEIVQYENPTGNKLMHYFNRIDGVDIDLTARQFTPSLSQYNTKQKLYNPNGRNSFIYEKSAYILKLRLGLI